MFLKSKILIMNIKLSIAIITYNRCSQLLEAIESCCDCILPEECEIVIVDNASTDNTESTIRLYMQNNPTRRIIYDKQKSNLGVGGGRARAFELSSGKYVYFMDDDAVIDPKHKDSFFMKSILIMDDDLSIASLTTAIHDVHFGDSRNCKNITGRVDSNGTFEVYRYNGGSHFLRKEVFDNPLYPSVKYANEELIPSILAVDKGFRNVYYGGVQIIHKPIINKWNDKDTIDRINVQSISNKFALKALQYPIVFYPLLRLSFEIRCVKQLKGLPRGRQMAKDMAKDILTTNKVKRVSIRTIIKLYRKFGGQVF